MRSTRWILWLAALLAMAALATVAAGCGGDDDAADDVPAATGETEEMETEPEAEPIRVGLVTDIGGLNDRGFNSLANEGLQRAIQDLGVEGRVLESKSDADYIPNLSQLAEEGYDLIISVGFLMGEATEQAANEFPDVNFAIIDFAYEAAPANLQGLVFKEQEVGYLAGVLAGQITLAAGDRSNDQKVISSVGGLKIPPVDKFIAGYQAGAKSIDEGITTLNGYSQDFVDQAKCKEVALDQISKGSDVVFQVAGGCGLGALDAADEQGVWGIGVDKEQGDLGAHVLTSALKRVDEAVFQTIESLVNGAFEGGGVTVFGAAEDGVGLGELADGIPQEYLDKVDEARQQIADGSVTPPENVE